MRFLRRSVYNGSGWWNESYRHSLAAKGIRTNFKEKRLSLQISYPAQQPQQPTQLAAPKEEVIRRIVKEQVSPQNVSIKLNELIKQGQIGPELIRAEYDRTLARVGEGDLSSWEDAQKLMHFDFYQETQLRAAVLKGALAQAQQAIPPNESALREMGLVPTQIEKVKEQFRLITTGLAESKAAQRAAGIRKLGAEVGAETLEEVGAGAKALGKSLKLGTREILKSGETPEQRTERLKKTAVPAMGWEAEEEAAGVFSPLKISGIDKIIAAKKAKAAKGEEKTKEEREWEVYPNAKRAREETEDIYRNRHLLAKVDMSAYDEGMKAFEKGDRESLIKSIFNLEAQNMKLKDRFNVVQQAKGNVLSRDTIVQTIHMANKRGEMMPNFLFGGGGGERIADQTKKMNQVMDDIKQNSNKLVARISLLYQKLKKVDGSIKPDRTMPQKDIVVTRDDSIRLIAPFDNFKGQLKHPNPVLEGIEEKSIKNPVFGDIEAEENEL
jgi:hypothetical protein